MLAKRIIPCLDIKNGKVVKGVNFVGLKDVGDPRDLAKEYDLQCADEVVFLDITATYEERDIIRDLIESGSETHTHTKTFQMQICKSLQNNDINWKNNSFHSIF